MNNELEIKISSSVEQANKKLDQLINTLNNGSKATDNLVKSAGNIGKTFNFYQVYYYARKFFNLFLDGIGRINKYSETLNMFHIVMGDLTDQADNFQNTMSKAFGNNTQQQLEYQSYFQTLTESMRLQEKYAYIISENMTKMTYDISSLFDKEQSDVASALRAGLVGQTKPVRNYGMDITENSLQPILDNLGIDRTVRELSQAEKEIVRYLALLQQSSIAHGDMANTIESPSNQLRILKNQLVECQRWFSALFIETFGNAMPYINGFVMAIKEICIWLGNLFGIEIQDYNSGIAEYYDEVEEEIDDATDSAKELKRQVLGFDQINNINENKDSGTGDVSGGIDQRLLDAIKGYNNGMENIRMKALDIRNAILDWLGFLLDGDDIVGYSLPKALKNVWKWWNNLNTVGKVFVSLGVATIVLKIVSAVKKLGTVLGSTGLFKVVTNLFSPVKSLVEAISAEGIAGGISLWSGTLTALESLSVALLGTAGIVVGFSLATDSAKKFAETGEITSNVIAGLGSSLLVSATSGALMGASIGGIHGAIIGGILGSISTLCGYMYGLKKVEDEVTQSIIDNSNEIYENSIAISEYRDNVYESALASLEEHEANKNLLESLKDLIDTNGKVKEGYETRVAYILNELNSAYGTEYSLIDGQIAKNGEVIKSIDSVIEEIDKLIEKKKAEVLLDSLKDNYSKALTNEKTYYMEYSKALKELTDAQNEYNKIYEQYYQDYLNQGASVDEAKMLANDKMYKSHLLLTQAVQTSAEAVIVAEGTWKSALEDISLYEDLATANTEENSEKIQQAMDNITNNYKSNGETIKMTLSDNLNYIFDYNEQMRKKYEETGNEITKKQLEDSEEMLNNTIESLVNQTNTIEQLTPEIVEAWGTLASKSENEFLTQFKKLPNDIQTEVVNEMSEKGYAISDELQKGIDEINPTIKIKTDTSQANTKIKIEADTSSADNSISNFIQKWREKFINGGFGAFGLSIGGGFRANGGIYSQGHWKPITQYANGGLPSTGELFIAREAGAELVGKIGNSTAVMNNLQIVDSVKAGVYEAVRDAMNITGGNKQAIKVYASKDVIVETAIEGINNITKQTGDNPIDLW